VDVREAEEDAMLVRAAEKAVMDVGGAAERADARRRRD